MPDPLTVPTVVPNEVPIAVLVRADYDPGPPSKKTGGPALKLVKGQIGWAFKSSRRSGWVLCQLNPDTLNEKFGWVDEKYLIPGKEKAPDGKLDIEKPKANKPAGGPPSMPLPTQALSRLDKSIVHFWHSIKANRAMIEEELPTVEEVKLVNQRLFGPGADKYASVIIKALRNPDHGPFREAIEEGNFDPLRLGDIGRLNNIIVTKDEYPQQPGLYIRIYPQLEGAVNFHIYKKLKCKPETGFYVGQVSLAYRWPGRLEEHERHMVENRWAHYKLANTMAASGRHTMAPILTFDPSDATVAELGMEAILDAAELTFICLFRSWHPILLGPDYNMTQTSAQFECFRAAKAFNMIMNTVKASNGWNPTQIVGCNFQTPMVTGRMRERLCCSWYDYKKQCTIFRCRRRVRLIKKSDGALKEATVQLSNPIRLQIGLEKIGEAKITESQTVHVVVEFMDDRDHDFMYVRYPRPGPNPALDFLRTMGIRIEWVDVDGKWWTAVVSRSQIWTTAKKDLGVEEAGITDYYRSGLGLATSLLCISWTNAPKWTTAYSLGMIVIKRFTYDHLKQQIKIEGPATSRRPWPADRTIDDNKALIIEHANANHWDVEVGSRPDAKLKKYQSGRKACDLCLSQCTTTPCPLEKAGGACNFSEDTGTCNACKMLRRPCTFTSDREVSSMREALQTDGKYGWLGMGTNINLHAGEGVAVQPMEEPFDPSVAFEDQAPDDEDTA